MAFNQTYKQTYKDNSLRGLNEYWRKQETGLTDEAATVDLFNINKHLDGLSRFIKACNTPMTISIQGSWGSGKTSIMKMVEHEIEKDVIL